MKLLGSEKFFCLKTAVRLKIFLAADMLKFMCSFAIIFHIVRKRTILWLYVKN